MGPNKVVLTKAHYFIELISYVFLLAGIILAVVFACSGRQIPTHYDLQGNIDAYGSASAILMLPIIMLLTNIITSFMLHFMPFKAWNMPFKVKPDRFAVVYGKIAYMVVIMELCISIFTLIDVLTQMFEKGNVMLQISFVFIACLFADIIWWCIAASRANKE